MLLVPANASSAARSLASASVGLPDTPLPLVTVMPAAGPVSVRPVKVSAAVCVMRPLRVVRQRQRGQCRIDRLAPMSESTVAVDTPWMVVAVAHLAYCPDVGVPELLTLPPPAEVLALAWPGVVKSQVIDAVLVSTRSVVSVASVAAVIYCASLRAPPPPVEVMPSALRAAVGIARGVELMAPGTIWAGRRHPAHHYATLPSCCASTTTPSACVHTVAAGIMRRKRCSRAEV